MNGQPIAASQFTLGKMLLLLASVSAVWILLRYLGRTFQSISDVRPRTRFLFRAVDSTLRVALWIAVLTFAMGLIAPSESALLVVIGSAVVAVGLGARDLVKNLIGGFVILVDRPYEVGDRVAMDGASGEIQDIGLRATKIVTQHGGLATIPNSKLLDGIALNENAGAPECVVEADFFLPADFDPDLALSVGREALITCPYLRLRRPTAITLDEGLSQKPYLSLRLRGYVYDHRFESQMRTDLLRRCKAELRRLGMA
jgi:small-conductance mechanosensitive channel